MKSSCKLLLLIALLYCLQATAANTLSQRQSERTHYTAGVVEFRPNSLGNVSENLAAYLEIINSAAAAATDIIVFPEMTLNSNADATLVPNHTLTPLSVPCDEPAAYHELLVELSCAARSVRKYLVVNVVEQIKCPDDPTDERPCASDGLNKYNTNVAFDREGRVVSRYRKINLYGEPRNVTWQPQMGWFDTDFGVRFGHFVCFDILFYLPSQALVDELHIRDFIFPTMWFSQLPFLTGVQFQFAWAYGNDVNFLAAGASRPQVGNTGSGIYVGRADPLAAVMTPGIGDRRLLVAEVPIKEITAPPSTQRLAAAQMPPLQPAHVVAEEAQSAVAVAGATTSAPFDMRMKRDYLELYNSVPLNFSTYADQHFTRELCTANHTLCCQFELRWHLLNATRGSQYYSYRLGVFDGWRREDGANENWLKNCALFACLDADDIMQCGQLYAADTDVLLEPQLAFELIAIEVTLPHKPRYLHMPNSLLDTLMPLPVSHFVWADELSGSNHTVRYHLNTTVSNLLTFAIYSNYFDASPNVTDKEDDDDAAVVATPPAVLTLTLALIALMASRR